MLGSRIKQPYSMSHQQYMSSKGLFYRGRVFSVKLSAWLRVIKTTCSHRQSSSQEEGKKGPGQESQVYPSKPLIRLCCFFSLRASLSEGWRQARIVSQVKIPPCGRKHSEWGKSSSLLLPKKNLQYPSLLPLNNVLPLGGYLIKDMQDLYGEKYKNLLKDIEEDLKNGLAIFEINMNEQKVHKQPIHS